MIQQKCDICLKYLMDNDGMIKLAYIYKKTLLAEVHVYEIFQLWPVNIRFSLERVREGVH